MARKRHTPEQVLAKLRDAAVMQSQWLAIAEIIRKLYVREQTFHHWRSQSAFHP